MISKSDLDQKIIALVAKFCGIHENKLSMDSQVNLELGVDGADADELIELISNELGWLLQDFEFDNYFGPELGYMPFLSLFRGRRKKLLPLTLSMLSEKYFASQPKA